ncbi:replication initiator protein [Blackfly microvirus SF02]|uniref:Replication initiator protein n=1 Tax=Blackfly microvirus SF02 TaxID=2576452 RepID=A0A4V1F5H6_9VIRU|nr:replication initiator protein [Blackfly microvirus SF02]
MVCTRPIEGYRAPGGQITFSRRSGWSDKPVTVPCGQCNGCRLEKSRQWAMRIMHEASLYEDNVFLTLTYNDNNLPQDESLILEHHQLFMKRLRKKNEGRTIRYYHCGEYGDTTLRPHYHTIVFNLDFKDKLYLKTTESGSKLYISEKLDDLWSHGDCYIGNVTFESAAYCGRYVMKKLTGARKSEYGSRAPEYSTMSRRPGIGSPWLQKWNRDCYPNDFCIMNGRKIRVPKAYDQLMINSETKIGSWTTDHTGFPMWMPEIQSTPMEVLKRKRIRSAAKHSDNQTRDRLDVIEELTQLRVDRLARS